MTSVVVPRLDGGPRLVIEDAQGLAFDFFTKDASSSGTDPYDAWTGRTDPDRITTDDLYAINRTMRARSPHTAWSVFTGPTDPPLPWLTALDPHVGLFDLDDPEWERGGYDALLADAFAAIIGPYRNLAVATKVLHLKRPRLFPVLDRLVVEQIGGIGRPVMTLMRHIRAQGRANYVGLSLIQADLEEVHLLRSHVRILDALLWASHPASSLGPDLAQWERRIGAKSDARPATEEDF